MSASDEWQLSPHKLLKSGDPVKLAYKQGLYRFVRVYTVEDRTYAIVVGPVGKIEIERIVSTDTLRSAGRARREDVAMSATLKQLSNNAKRKR